MPFSRTRRRRNTALLALAGLLATSGIASAAASRIRRPVTDAPAPPAATPAPVAPSGSRTLPAPLPDNPMREIAPGVYEGIVPVRLPDGSWQVDLDERFHQFSVARRADGGGITRACAHGAEGLARWQRAGGTPAACGHTHRAAAPAPAPATATRVPAAAPKGGVTPKVTTPAGAKPATWEVR
jgi:hypothetical protein